jgi:hypothetical protein
MTNSQDANFPAPNEQDQRSAAYLLLLLVLLLMLREVQSSSKDNAEPRKRLRLTRRDAKHGYPEINSQFVAP